jgi:hypothetical protein
MRSVGRLVEDLDSRGVRLTLQPPDRIGVAGPEGVMVPELHRELAARKAELLILLRAEAALAMLARLKAYTLPSGRMPVAREMVERLEGLREPAEILAALYDLERQLIALGGEFDSGLADAITGIQKVFPGARLIEVRKPQ